MKKIAIMTWYTFRNYGTVLQAVALNRVIRDFGYDVSTIAYNPLERKKPFAERVLNKIERLLSASDYSSDEKELLFENFIKENICLTSKIHSSEEFHRLNSDFDAFVCGSDQIWGPRWLDTRFYLDFVEKADCKIAYAPSFGCSEIPEDNKRKKISSCLMDFGSISVREKSGAEIVESLIGKKPPVVLDPTLLLDDEKWDEYARTCFDKSKRYCLFYFLGNNPQNYHVAKKIAEDKGLKIKILPVFSKDFKLESSIHESVGPSEFLTLLKNADYVCTDSFHGMVFSVIFHKQFVAFERFKRTGGKSQNTRIYNFLNLMGLNNVLLGQDSLNEWEQKTNLSIDYKHVDDRLETLRKDSLAYLKSALDRAACL